jgi:putative transposase
MSFGFPSVGGRCCTAASIHIARTYLGRQQNFLGQHFWARGHYVSTVGRDEASIRAYIEKQREEDKRLDQLTMFRE